MWMIITLITATHNATKLRKDNKTSNVIAKQAVADEEYKKICCRVTEILKIAEKPSRCNIVKFIDSPFLFPNMVSYQYMGDWEVWRTNDLLYLYQAEVEMYPANSSMDAPEICSIIIENIQYFKLEGSVETNTYVTGGKVTQNKRTGKVSQTALKNKTVKSDSRYVKMSVVIDGLVKTLAFNKESYDIFLLLIPEKEYNKVI